MIANCGYFEKVHKGGEDKNPEDLGDEAEFEVVETQDVPHADSDEVQASLPPEVPEEPIPSQDSQRLKDESLTQSGSQQQVC